MTTDAGNRYRDLVAQALEAAGAVDDQELKRIAFEHVLDHLLGNGDDRAATRDHALAEVPQVTPEASDPIDSSLATEQQRIDAAAHYFDISPEQVQDLFDLRGEEPQLSLHSTKLAARKTAAVREIALLIGGVRTAVALETSTNHIQAVAKTYDKFDSNFMATLSKMPEVAVLGKRGSQNRAVRMKVIGAEAARPLAQRLVS